MRKKLKQAGVDDFEYIVEQDKLLVKKIKSMRNKGMSFQKIADIFNHWKIPSRAKRSKWYAKTVRDLIIY